MATPRPSVVLRVRARRSPSPPPRHRDEERDLYDRERLRWYRHPELSYDVLHADPVEDLDDGIHYFHVALRRLFDELPASFLFDLDLLSLLSGAQTVVLDRQLLPLAPFRRATVRVEYLEPLWMIQVVCDCQQPGSVLCECILTLALERWAVRLLRAVSRLAPTPLLPLGWSRSRRRHCRWCHGRAYAVCDFFLNRLPYFPFSKIRVDGVHAYLQLPDYARRSEHFDCLSHLQQRPSDDFPFNLHLSLSAELAGYVVDDDPLLRGDGDAFHPPHPGPSSL
ncbi:protein ORF14 [Pigeon adenovirus 1]|uniref:Protein ORF14 n=1 Tax=Pigeon adenovirus 1 TaxID=764030 RepID=X5M206_9ADEN|nr:protein ORF14 [Pigeon adenovirus 1]CDO33892.1 protein ORF14 [Pigeon adenovirus 1]